MHIDQELIRKAKEQLGDRNAEIIADIMELKGYDTRLRKSLCPFHDEDTPSFIYNPKSYAFHCFGKCARNYDLIDVLMAKEHLTYAEAALKLFDFAGLDAVLPEIGVRSGGDYYYPAPIYASNKDIVYAYWAKRCISKETIDYLDIQQDPRGNTLFQYYDTADVLTMVKVRISGPVPKGEIKCWCAKDENGRSFGTKPILYNMNRINVGAQLIITSGEGDCAAAIECGYTNTVSIPLGDGNTHWISECWDWLNNFNDIILVHDNDESGEKFARDVASRLGEYRVKVVDLPKNITIGDKVYAIKDLNELLFRCGKDAVRESIDNARNSEVQTVVDYADVKRFDMSDVDGFRTGLVDFDRAIDKFYAGTTTILTGVTGAGKSSLLSTLICRSVEHGFPTFVYSGELSNPSLKNWVDCVHAGQRHLEKFTSAGTEYYKLKPEAYEKINNFYKHQIYFYKDGVDHKTSHLFATMEAVVRRYGVKTVIVDNLTCVDLENNDENKYIKQDEFIRDIIEFAKKWSVVCIIVLHPRKLDCVRRMNLFDLQGVVSAVNLAHRVISLYRVTEKDRQGVQRNNGTWVVPPINCDVQIEVLKDRFGAGAGKIIDLWYDVPSRRFYDSLDSLDYKYAWDADSDYTGTPLPFGCSKLEQEPELFYGGATG